MRNHVKIKFAALLAVGAAGLSATPAMANRCGNSLSIDVATTLAKVAKQCNVSLKELREANGGIGNDRVRPGDRLAIPDEPREWNMSPDSADDVVADVDDTSDTTSSSHPYIVSYDTTVADDYAWRNDPYEVADSDRHRVRVRDTRVSKEHPSWLSRDARSGRHFEGNDRLTFQARSKLRLAAVNTPSYANESTPQGLGETTLIECATLRPEPGTSVHEVRKILSSPGATYVEIDKNPAGAQECTLIKSSTFAGSGKDKLAAADAGVPLARFTDKPAIAALKLRAPVEPAIHVSKRHDFTLQGDVVGVSEGCLILRTKQNDLWRLSAMPPSGDLVGKHVTVSGVAAAPGACGVGPAMTVSHAVYAERLGSR